MRLFYFSFIFIFYSRCEDVFKGLKKKRARYLKGLSLLKKGYLILASLESDLFVDSSDFFKALECFQHGNYDEAIPILKELIKRDIYKFESTFLLAECFFEKGKMVKLKGRDNQWVQKASVFYNKIALQHSKHRESSEYLDIVKTSFLKLRDCCLILELKTDAIAVTEKYLEQFPDEKSNADIVAFCKQNNCSYLLELDNESNNNHEGISLVVKKKKNIKCKN